MISLLLHRFLVTVKRTRTIFFFASLFYFSCHGCLQVELTILDPFYTGFFNNTIKEPIVSLMTEIDKTWENPDHIYTLPFNRVIPWKNGNAEIEKQAQRATDVSERTKKFIHGITEQIEKNNFIDAFNNHLETIRKHYLEWIKSKKEPDAKIIKQQYQLLDAMAQKLQTMRNSVIHARGEKTNTPSEQDLLLITEAYIGSIIIMIKGTQHILNAPK